MNAGTHDETAEWWVIEPRAQSLRARLVEVWILAVRLLSPDGREIGVARRDEPLMLNVTFSLLTPGVTARCLMSLTTRGVLAFRTAQPEEIRAVEPSIFSATVQVPPRLLADSIYSVKLGISLNHDGDQSALVQDNALTFRVYASDDEKNRSLLARELYRGTSSAGAVMPDLDWRVTKDRDIVTAPS